MLNKSIFVQNCSEKLSYVVKVIVAQIKIPIKVETVFKPVLFIAQNKFMCKLDRPLCMFRLVLYLRSSKVL